MVLEDYISGRSGYENLPVEEIIGIGDENFGIGFTLDLYCPDDDCDNYHFYGWTHN